MLGPQSVDPPLHLLFHLVVLLLVATRIIVVIFTTILLLILSLLSSLLFIRSPGTPPVFQRGSTNPPRYQEKLSSSWIWLDRFPARDDHLTQNHKVEKIRSFKRLSYPKIFIKIAKEKWLWFFLSNRILELGKLNSHWQDHFVVLYFLSLFDHQFTNNVSCEIIIPDNAHILWCVSGCSQTVSEIRQWLDCDNRRHENRLKKHSDVSIEAPGRTRGDFCWLALPLPARSDPVIKNKIVFCLFADLNPHMILAVDMISILYLVQNFPICLHLQPLDLCSETSTLLLPSARLRK